MMKDIEYEGKTYEHAGGIPADLAKLVAEAAEKILEAEKILLSYELDAVWIQDPVIMYDGKPMATIEIEDSWVNIWLLQEKRDG